MSTFTWSNLNNSVSGNWNAIGCDSTGKYIVAAVFFSSIYYSHDYGVTWTAGTGAPSIEWTGIAVSSNGQYVAASASNGNGVYTSSDYGVNWINKPGVSGCGDIASDSTCQKLAVVVGSGGTVWTSTNFGGTWTQRSNSTNQNWQCISSNSTGTILAAGYQTGEIYTSEDSGATWTLRTAIGENWYSITSDSTGQFLAACATNPGHIWTSIDFGHTWNQTSAPIGNWAHIASNSTGTFLIAAWSGGYIYISEDSGATWTPQLTPGIIVNTPWNVCCTNSTGTILAVSDGNIWIAEKQGPPTPPTPPTPISNICFIEGTLIETDNGIIPIEKINPKIHTINNKEIIAITKTLGFDNFLVCFDKHAIAYNFPNKQLIVSPEHKIFYNGKMIKAKNFINYFENVKKIKYNGEIMYNILMKNYDKINVHNLICETLDPKNIIAKLYTNNYGANYKNNLIIMMNDFIKKNDYISYKKLSSHL